MKIFLLNIFLLSFCISKIKQNSLKHINKTYKKNNYIIINNINKRNLEEEYKKNENINKTNTTNAIDTNIKNPKIEKSSGIGWLGNIIIIILSIIVIYVLYYGFRYYRRKKYQNPSFYYKITEEMFADITPIE